MFVAISAFALVLSVSTLAVGAWSMSNLVRELDRLESLMSGFQNSLRTLEGSVERSKNATLAAAVDDLRGAIETLSASNRREFGRLWAKLPKAPEPVVIDGNTGEVDPEFRAFLDLQSKG